MKESLLRYLVCPACKQDLALEAGFREEGEIMSGRLLCSTCGGAYPIIRGVPRFVGSDSYTRSFSFQWNLHNRLQVDSLSGHQESRTTFKKKTGFRPEELSGKLTLDVGCGTGRYMEVAADLGAQVIGVDLSLAVEAAFGNMGRRAHVHVVQADVFSLPFRAETFDAIYSIGVLHHTTSTRKAFLSLPPLLKRGGIVAIWVYAWAGEYSQNVDRVRRVTRHLPRRLLYVLCWLAVPLLHAFAKLPVLWRVARRIPTSNQQLGMVWDVLDTFDLWSPRYQWKHTPKEVRDWFEKADLEDVRPMGWPVSMRGRRVKG